ncbi:MAG: hypothetical protein HPY69_12840 [Armatimonadetes bacterium]|nr:hypothetical protein [Armatimonadota bacterium]
MATPISQRPLVVVWLCGAMLIFAASTGVAWNPPEADEHYGRMIVNGKPSGPEVVTYSARPYRDGPYYPKAHAYILQHAIRLLRQDGYENWADMAQAHLDHLLSGAAHADAYKGRITATLQLEVLFGLFTRDLKTWDITCFAGCDHYHNCDDGSGLHLQTYSVIAQVLDKAIAKFALTIGSLVGLDVDVRPDLPPSFPSAVDLCQQHFDRALTTYRSGSPIYPDRSAEQSAYYELGWACHLLADMAVAQHQHNAFIGGHADYEDFADHKGDPDDHPAYHPASAKAFGAYHHGSNPWPARQFAETVARQTYGDPDNYNLAEKGGDNERDMALAFALPRAEAFTAGLLARFMAEAGIPPQVPALTGFVRGHKGAPIAGAYVFFTTVGRTFQIEQSGGAGGGQTPDPAANWRAWSTVRTDSHGRYELPIVPDTYYLLRPAMPGYSYEGKTSRNLEFGPAELPAVYQQARGMTSGNTLDLHLTELPRIAALSIALPAGEPVIAAAPPGRASVVGSLPRTIAAGVALRKSGTELSSALADNIHASLLTLSTDRCLLGVAGGGTGLPESAVVRVQLSRLLSLVSARVCLQKSDIVQAVDETRYRQLQAVSAAGEAAAAVKPPPPVLTGQALTALTGLVPTLAISAAGGDAYQVAPMGAPGDGAFGRDSLLGSGLVLVPDLGGAEIEVTATSGPGWLAAANTPMKLITDAAGTASFTVRTGSHAGLLRLTLRAINSPDGVALPRTAAIEFLIQPPVKGPDPVPETPASLQAGVTAQVLHTAAIQAAWQPDCRVEVAAKVQPGGAPQPSVRPERRVPGTRAPEPQRTTDEVVLSENFEGRLPDGWELRPGWRITEHPAGQHCLHGRGPGAATYGAQKWRDFDLRFRLRLTHGTVHIAFRVQGSRRYHLGVSPERVYLARQTGPDGARELASVADGLATGRFVPFEIRCHGSVIQLHIAGEEAFEFRDTEPLAAGGLGFETLEDSEAFVDDVLVTAAP